MSLVALIANECDRYRRNTPRFPGETGTVRRMMRKLRAYGKSSAAWSSKISTLRKWPRSVSTLLCLLTSMSLNTEAPLATAEIKNPDRRLWPEKSAGS